MHHRHSGLCCLARTEEFLAPGVLKHEDRVANLACFLSYKLGTTDDFTLAIRTAARFHDIGKMAVPHHVLSKPAALTAEEWAAMKRHPDVGHKILADTSDRLMALAADGALSHHERYDGTGYPQHLKGDAIPLIGRIVGLCDIYDALREDRVYRPGLAHQDALQIIAIGDGRTQPSHFDPEVLGAFCANEAEFCGLYESSATGAR